MIITIHAVIRYTNAQLTMVSHTSEEVVVKTDLHCCSVCGQLGLKLLHAPKVALDRVKEVARAGLSILDTTFV